VKIGTAGNIVPDVLERVGIGRGCSDDLLVIKFIFYYLHSAFK